MADQSIIARHSSASQNAPATLVDFGTGVQRVIINTFTNDVLSLNECNISIILSSIIYIISPVLIIYFDVFLHRTYYFSKNIGF